MPEMESGVYRSFHQIIFLRIPPFYKSLALKYPFLGMGSLPEKPKKDVLLFYLVKYQNIEKFSTIKNRTARHYRFLYR